MKIRYLVFSLAALFYACNSASAEYIPMLVSADDVKVFHGMKVIATLKKDQMVYQTARQGRWIGVHWEDKSNGKMLRGWVRDTFLSRAPRSAISAIGTPAPNNPATPAPAPAVPEPAPEPVNDGGDPVPPPADGAVDPDPVPPPP
ncbi:MAG: hypothetical protein QGF00_14130 [Planctomycetota bacterium]|jgi:hypothetical protein|nr:hypothetical protein [Planctomycetota bacterium]MDP7250739.1 hypothetical protein [Planctomycetota bacterium]